MRWRRKEILCACRQWEKPSSAIFGMPFSFFSQFGCWMGHISFSEWERSALLFIAAEKPCFCPRAKTCLLSPTEDWQTHGFLYLLDIFQYYWQTTKSEGGVCSMVPFSPATPTQSGEKYEKYRFSSLKPSPKIQCRSYFHNSRILLSNTVAFLYAISNWASKKIRRLTPGQNISGVNTCQSNGHQNLGVCQAQALCQEEWRLWAREKHYVSVFVSPLSSASAGARK